MKWEKAKLENCCEVTSSKRIFYSEYVDNGIPFYRSKEIIEKKQGKLISEPLYISEEKYEEIKNKFGVPCVGDMLLTSVGTIGIPYIVKSTDKFYFKDGNLTWFKNFNNKLLSKYLFYWICSPKGAKTLYNTTIGSSQKALTIAALKNIEIELPALEIQNKIVSILSAYDDLIENNQKQIKLLEEAAQRLYKEWFVDLHFPGYEITPIIDGVPKGWTKKSVENSLEMYIGGGWGKEVPTGNNVIAGKVIRGTDINDIKAGNFKDVPLRYHTKNDISKRNLQKYDIVFELSNGNINNIGRSILIDDFILEKCGENTICASFCKLFRPLDKVHSLILYCEIQDMQNSGRMLPFKKQGSNGINNFAFEEFLNHEFLLPNVEKFIKPIDNIINLISVLQNQVSELIEARDRLLPKLMNGELEV